MMRLLWTHAWAFMAEWLHWDKSILHKLLVYIHFINIIIVLFIVLIKLIIQNNKQ